MQKPAPCFHRATPQIWATVHGRTPSTTKKIDTGASICSKTDLIVETHSIQDTEHLETYNIGSRALELPARRINRHQGKKIGAKETLSGEGGWISGSLCSVFSAAFPFEAFL